MDTAQATLIGVAFTGAVALLNSFITSWVNADINRSIKMEEIKANKEIKKQEYNQKCHEQLFLKRFDICMKLEDTVFPIFELMRDRNDGKYFFAVFQNIEYFQEYLMKVQQMKPQAYWLTEHARKAYEDFADELLFAYDEYISSAHKDIEAIGKSRHNVVQIRAHEFAIRLNVDYKHIGDVESLMEERHQQALLALGELEKHKPTYIADQSSQIDTENRNENRPE